jgi:hypothetical protein
MYESILQSLKLYSVQIISMFGAINPYLGAGATAVFALLIAWYTLKAKKEKKEDQNQRSDETIGNQTGKDQGTVDKVENRMDDFLK